MGKFNKLYVKLAGSRLYLSRYVKIENREKLSPFPVSPLVFVLVILSYTMPCGLHRVNLGFAELTRCPAGLIV